MSRGKMEPHKEAEIIINGLDLGPACAMTIRVAIEVFADDLIENGLDDDYHGKSMVRLYQERIDDIRKAMKVMKDQEEK